MIRQCIAQLLTLIDVAAPSASLNANGNGAAIDLGAYEGEVAVMLAAKSVSGTTPTLDVKLQDSDDGVAGWADIGGMAFAQVNTVASSQKLALKSDSCKRYIRAVDTVGGTTPVYARSVQALGLKKNLV
jgi:hypothetical protein